MSSETIFNGVEESINQFQQVLEISLKQLRTIKDENPNEHGFIDAHILLLEDPILKDEVIDVINKNHINALAAFNQVIDRYINIMKDASDKYLQERYLDFLDVKLRVTQNFNNVSISLSNLEECILVVEELYPSLLVNISKNVKGIVALRGGFTSHSAILCRMMGIPFVLADIDEEFDGNILILNDKVYLNPTNEIVEQFNEQKEIAEDYIKECF